MLAPEAKLPIVQLIVPAANVPDGVPVAVIVPNPLGITSFTSTFVAAWGPLFVNLTV